VAHVTDPAAIGVEVRVEEDPDAAVLGQLIGRRPLRPTSSFVNGEDALDLRDVFTMFEPISEHPKHERRPTNGRSSAARGVRQRGFKQLLESRAERSSHHSRDGPPPRSSLAPPRIPAVSKTPELGDSDAERPGAPQFRPHRVSNR
jgi:hypothetical protein